MGLVGEVVLPFEGLRELIDSNGATAEACCVEGLVSVGYAYLDVKLARQRFYTRPKPSDRKEAKQGSEGLAWGSRYFENLGLRASRATSFAISASDMVVCSLRWALACSWLQPWPCRPESSTARVAALSMLTRWPYSSQPAYTS